MASRSSGLTTDRKRHRRRQHRAFRHLYFTSGRHYLEVLIERMGGQSGVIVGVAPASRQFESGGFLGPDGMGTIGYCANGEIVSDGERVGRAEPFREGDIIGVFVDMNSLVVGFYLNDQAQTQIPTAWLADDDDNTSVSNGNGTEMEELKSSQEEERSVVKLSLRHRALVAAVSLSPGTDKVVVYVSDVPREMVR